MYPYNASRPSHGQPSSIPAPPPASSSSSQDPSTSLNQLVAPAVVSSNPERTQNAIGHLQNVARKTKVAMPEIIVKRKGGRDHDPVFEAVCTWNNSMSETVQAGSKNEAKRRAAYNMLMRLKSMNVNIEIETKSKNKQSKASQAWAFPSTPSVNSSCFFIDRGTAPSQETKSPTSLAYSNGNMEAPPVVHTPYVPPIKSENLGYMNRTGVPFPPPQPMCNALTPSQMLQANSRQLQRHDVNPHAHLDLPYRNQRHPPHYHLDGSPSRSRPREIGASSNGGSSNNHHFHPYSHGYPNVRYPRGDGRRGAHQRKSSGDLPFEYSSSDRNRYRPNMNIPHGHKNTSEKPRVAPRPSFALAMGGTATKPNLSGELPPILHRDLSGNLSDPRLKLQQQRLRDSSEKNNFPVKKEVILNSTNLYELAVKGSGKIDDSAEEAVMRQEEQAEKVETKNHARRLSVQREMLKGRDRIRKGVITERAATDDKLDNSEKEEKETERINSVDCSKDTNRSNETHKKMDSAEGDSPEKLKPSDEKNTPRVELDGVRCRQQVVGRKTKIPLSEKKKLMDVDSQSQESVKLKSERPLVERKLPTVSNNIDTNNSRSKNETVKTTKTIEKEVVSKEKEHECTISEPAEVMDKSEKIENGYSAARKANVILQNRTGNIRSDEKGKKVSIVNEDNGRNSKQLPIRGRIIPPPRRSARERIARDSVVKTENVSPKKRNSPGLPKSSLGRYTPRRKTRSMTRAENLAADASGSPEKKVETPSPMDSGPSSPKKKVEMPSPKKSVRSDSSEKKVETSSTKKHTDFSSPEVKSETISVRKRVASSNMQKKVGTPSSRKRAASGSTQNRVEIHSAIRSTSPNSEKKVEIPSPTKRTKTKKADVKLDDSPSDVKNTQKRVVAKESKRRMMTPSLDEKDVVDADLSKDKAGPIIARPTVHKFLLAAAPVTVENDGDGTGDAKESIDSETVALPVKPNGQENNEMKVNGHVDLKKPNGIGIEVSIDTETREVQMGSVKGRNERGPCNANGPFFVLLQRKPVSEVQLHLMVLRTQQIHSRSGR